MSRKKREKIYSGQWTGMHYEVIRSAAWKQLSFGARALFLVLRTHMVKNNGHVYLAQRDAQEELGRGSRNDIANWYRELVHYGFLVMTSAASLGVEGKGKAPHYRFTDMATADHGATRDFLRWDGTVFEPHVAPSRKWSSRKSAALQKQNPGLHVGARVDCTLEPSLDCTLEPPNPGNGSHVQSIQPEADGSHVQSISRIATLGRRAGSV